MNMSGDYSGHYYQPFGPPNQPFGPPDQRYGQPNYPPNYPWDYNNLYPPNYPGQPQYFAEYSLWGTSSYNTAIQPSLLFPSLPSTSEEPQRPSLRPQMPPKPPDDNILEDERHSLAIGGTEETIVTGLEEPSKKIITKEELFKLPNDFDYIDFSDSNTDCIEQSSNSSGSNSGDWMSSNFQRAGSAYPWASRSSRVNNRGKKANIMQRRLVKALSQPVKMDKGASMMQRMGWMGGGLGRDESGIVDPIEPNAVYASTTAGFGQEESIPQLPIRKATRLPLSEKRRNNMNEKEHFKTNVLLKLLDFVKDDLILELYFDTQLKNSERKRIHRLVAALDGQESTIQLDSTSQQEIVNDIHRRNRYTLTTQSEGDGLDRQLCVFKSAPSDMFLVTPDDIRPCITEIKEVEEESNPFLKSITKHIKNDEGTILQPKPPYLFDKLVEFFIDFCGDETFTEFRFLGPFTDKEINVINNFFSLIEDLSEKRKPVYRIPTELLDVFATDYRYYELQDPNGFFSIKKVHCNLNEDYEKQKKEESQRRTEQSEEKGPL